MIAFWISTYAFPISSSIGLTRIETTAAQRIQEAINFWHTHISPNEHTKSMRQVAPDEELNVNDFGVLKPPLLLWLILLIETWHFWATILTVFSGQTWLLSENTGWINFALDMPPLLVLMALWSRVPSANTAIRTIWHRGRELLTIAALGNLGMIVFSIAQIPVWRLDSDWPTLLGAFLHAWALARIWMSSIIEMVFAEFPDPKLGDKHG